MAKHGGSSSNPLNTFELEQVNRTLGKLNPAEPVEFCPLRRHGV